MSSISRHQIINWTLKNLLKILEKYLKIEISINFHNILFFKNKYLRFLIKIIF